MVSAKCLPVRPLLQALEHDRGVDAAKGKVIGDYEVGVDVALLTYDVAGSTLLRLRLGLNQPSCIILTAAKASTAPQAPKVWPK